MSLKMVEEISKHQISEYTVSVFGEQCHKFVARLPLVPLKFVMHKGEKSPVYSVNELIAVLHTYTTSEKYNPTTITHKVRSGLLLYLKGLNIEKS